MSNSFRTRVASMVVTMLACVALPSRPVRAEIVRGEILSIDQLLNLVWVKGDHCRSQRMCEGALYAGVRVALPNDKVVRLDRLVLLHPETTDCRTGDAYWAITALAEVFSPERSGAIDHHSYARIHIGPLEATPIDLTAATDRSMGFAADGPGYMGSMELIVDFDEPFPEDARARSFCAEDIADINPIYRKVLKFGPMPPSPEELRREIPRRADVRK